MKNGWYSVWNNRKSDLENIRSEDETKIILELKKMVGWDFYGTSSQVKFEEFKKEYEYLKNNLKLDTQIGTVQSSVFEVGCGSGAYLYFFKKDGFNIGGLDYSENLLKAVRKVIGEKNLLECICAEAAILPTDKKYYAVFCAAVLQYFESLEYVEKVLDKMLLKSQKSIGVLRILNEETKEKYLEFRSKNDSNFKEKYKNTPHLFISKDFFINYAKKHDLDCKFDQYHIENFWNDQYLFDCFLYKKER